jgi:hypothetical protein
MIVQFCGGLTFSFQTVRLFKGIVPLWGRQIPCK